MHTRTVLAVTLAVLLLAVASLGIAYAAADGATPRAACATEVTSVMAPPTSGSDAGRMNARRIAAAIRAERIRHLRAEEFCRRAS